ncbi:MAG TPA: paraquat-inducible protein A [Burkholderiaceae bacterium]|nr:paraquat-inducible protein A [Burkholderiaceae bacterium]
MLTPDETTMRGAIVQTATRRVLAGLGLVDRGSAVRAHPELVACEGCDAVYRRRSLSAGAVARCPRCGATLGRGHRLAVDGQLALASGALVVFVLANVSDIVKLNLRGVHSEVTLWESVWSTWLSGQEVVALLAGATAFAFPLAVILLRLYVLAPLAAGRRVRGFVPAMRALRWVTRWSMVEVFLFGALVAIVKIGGLASVVPGVGIFSFGVLTLLLAANQAAGLHGIWQHASKLPS